MRAFAVVLALAAGTAGAQEEKVVMALTTYVTALAMNLHRRRCG